ncbi:MAG: hypothetical protein QF578_04190 [Alphaproteobacteria bacterium]|jgi:thiol:disulfide interchange protein|nr:hypothetical protein [Alphaproteobacteria bacterium]MDP6564002.1 hypothetical protein [Alphaproteobacteria bacterium]
MQLAFALVLLLPIAAQAGDRGVPYSPQVVKAALDKGCAVFLDFYADW